MLGNIAATVIKLGTSPDRDDFMSQLGIYLSLGTVVFLTIYYLFKRQVAQRHQAEVVLSQQTKRERVVNQIAQHIRQSLNLEKVLVTTVSEVREFLDCDRLYFLSLTTEPAR